MLPLLALLAAVVSILSDLGAVAECRAEGMGGLDAVTVRPAGTELG